MITHTFFSSPIGNIRIVIENHLLRYIDFSIEPVGDQIKCLLSEKIQEEFVNYFEKKKAFSSLFDFLSLSHLPSATPFKVSVWKALLEIPYGHTFTYQEIAKKSTSPNAIRASASAIASNPLAILIPCHRVVPKQSPPGKYRWGSDRKKALLDLEKRILKLKENPDHDSGSFRKRNYPSAQRC